MTPTVRLRRTRQADADIALPHYATAGAAGADLHANLAPSDRDSGIRIESMARAVIPTGLMAEIPEGFEIQIRPRSGLAVDRGITVLNAPGTIDNDYRGEIAIVLVNLGTEAYTVRHGERVAQCVIASVFRASFSPVAGLSATRRGKQGFGSTGRHG